MGRTICIVIAMLLMLGCSGPGSTTSTGSPAPGSLSDKARTYLLQALDSMETRSLNRDRIDWKTVRSRALFRADGARTAADTYPAIRQALAMLKVNGHSRLLTPRQWRKMNSAPVTGSDRPTGTMFPGSVAYVQVPSLDKSAADSNYPQWMQNLITHQHTVGACGWIVDLRGNGGGSIGPMIEGLAPLLGRGELGAFVGPDGDQQPWNLNAAGYSVDGRVQSTVQRPLWIGETPPVALLIGPHTASAAEGVVIAFHGRAHTRSFGHGTAGVPTANVLVRLSDGARMVLTTAQEADRAGHIYPDRPIQPDQLVTDRLENAPWELSTHTRTNPVIAAALSWLHQQQSCRTG